MHLNILHETTLVGAIAINPYSHNTEYDSEIIRSNGQRRWYLEFSRNPQVLEIIENKSPTSLFKSKTQFGTQTSRPKTKVWQTEEGVGRELTNKSLYTPPGTKKSKPYSWPTTTFHGQSQGHNEHILKPGK